MFEWREGIPGLIGFFFQGKMLADLQMDFSFLNESKAVEEDESLVLRFFVPLVCSIEDVYMFLDPTRIGVLPARAFVKMHADSTAI